MQSRVASLMLQGPTSKVSVVNAMTSAQRGSAMKDALLMYCCNLPLLVTSHFLTRLKIEAQIHHIRELGDRCARRDIDAKF